jgi:ABC-type glutathione transport system ATPase component
MHADRIFVLEQGHIVESGRHADLLEEKGLYYAMWRQQVGERRLQNAPDAQQLQPQRHAPRGIAVGTPG